MYILILYICQFLDLNNNLICSIATSAFSNMSNLRHLRMDQNQLKELSTQMLEPLSSIHMINMSQNMLRHVLHEYGSGLGDANKIECNEAGG